MVSKSASVTKWTLRVVMLAPIIFSTTAMAVGEDATTVSRGEDRKHLVMIVAECEYGTAKTLPKFARRFLGDAFRVSFVNADPKDANRLVGLDAIKQADIILISVRRSAFPKKQLDSIREFVTAGKPVVGIRTASHAFSIRTGTAPEGHTQWPEFDRDVLGGNYHGHYPKRRGAGPSTYIKINTKAATHPILKGIESKEIPVHSWLYKTRPLGPNASVLMTGRAFDQEAHEPVAWTNTNKYGGKVFYTSLGHRNEFELPAFQRLLVSGIYWAAGLKVPKELDSQPASAKQSARKAKPHAAAQPGLDHGGIEESRR